MNFKNKIIWITGASSGIGEALVYCLEKEGALLIISARRENELLRVRNNCQNTENITILPMDITETEKIADKVNQVALKFGRIDILINNSGISQRSLVKETPPEIDRKVMEVNYFGPVYLTKAVLPLMIKSGGGRLIVTGSVVSKFGFPLRSAYSASKHALQGFFDSLRAELRNDNIKVGIIIAGRIVSNISINAITKDGSSYGKMDEGQANGVPTDKAAKIIVNGIKKDKPEIYVGGRELIMVQIRRFFPRLYYKLASTVKPT